MREILKVIRSFILCCHNTAVLIEVAAKDITYDEPGITKKLTETSQLPRRKLADHLTVT